MRKNVVFDVQKKLYNLPELGGGGGEVIWAMPERNRFFLWEVFPISEVIFIDILQSWRLPFLKVHSIFAMCYANGGKH